MRIRTLLLACAASLALLGVASAQSPVPPGYPALPPGRIAVIVRASGFDPLFRPMRQGDTYVLRALDRNEVEHRLVLDAYTGRTISIRALGSGPYAARPRPYPGPYRGRPAYGPYGGPVYGRVFGPDDGYARRPSLPLRDMPQVRPPQTVKATQALRPSANNTTQPPLPRPRPYVMEATSSIPADAPKPAEPQKTPPPPPAPQNPVPAAPPAPPAPPADMPQNNGGAAMPPVTPLD